MVSSTAILIKNAITWARDGYRLPFTGGIRCKFLCILVLASSCVPAAPATSEVVFITEELPWAVPEREYSPTPLQVRVSGKCPAGGVGFEVVSGILPPGVKLSRLGYFSGAPAKIGAFEINIRAVNGCSWTARHFTLVVAKPPTLSVEPGKVTLRCAAGQSPPPAMVRIAATWPRLSYRADVTGAEWLTAIPEQGRTSGAASAGGELHTDNLILRIAAVGMKPGVYSATVHVSAWQAHSETISVELTVEASKP
jgi:hypothetical protein